MLRWRKGTSYTGKTSAAVNKKGGRQMQEPGLCEIALGGFQTFDELTRIPIGRLTFMFGPNSAGKSAVEDGLQLLSEVYDYANSS